MCLRLMCLEGIADLLEDDDQNDDEGCDEDNGAVARDDDDNCRGDKSKTSREGREGGHGTEEGGGVGLGTRCYPTLINACVPIANFAWT